jgi:hypothetical protein
MLTYPVLFRSLSSSEVEASLQLLIYKACGEWVHCEDAVLYCREGEVIACDHAMLPHFPFYA